MKEIRKYVQGIYTKKNLTIFFKKILLHRSKCINNSH